MDREYSQLAPDSRMVKSFEASYDRVHPSMTNEDWQAVTDHSAVAYFLSPPIHQDRAVDISGQALQLTSALLQHGGTAAKGESAGIVHGRAKWLKLATDYVRAVEKTDVFDFCSTLYWAWVRRPLLDLENDAYYSCGLHLLGLPDVEIESSLELNSALEWIVLLGLYLAADRPQRPLLDGEGFRLRNEGPRRIMRMKPCQRYAEDEFFYNPDGYIRLEKEAPVL